MNRVRFFMSCGTVFTSNLINLLLKQVCFSVTEKQIYDFLIKNAQDFISPARVDVLKFSLAMRIHSPQVEAFRQVRRCFNVKHVWARG